MEQSPVVLKARLLAALAHPNRIRILEYLQKDTRCNCEIAPALGLEQSNLSRHLKLLVQAGVLVSWKDGLRVNFKLADSRIFKILDLAESFAKEDLERKVEVLERA
jgi:DNA-binding transcriptional ArsR family regulator